MSSPIPKQMCNFLNFLVRSEGELIVYLKTATRCQPLIIYNLLQLTNQLIANQTITDQLPPTYKSIDLKTTIYQTTQIPYIWYLRLVHIKEDGNTPEP